MEYFDAFIAFMQTIFNALTAFLGKSIPFVSEIGTVIAEPTTTAEGEAEADA